MLFVASFYERAQSTATRLLTQFGALSYVQIERESAGIIGGAAGEKVGQTTTTTSLVGVVTKVPDKLVDGARIVASDRMLILDSATPVLMSDKFLIDGAKFKPVEISEVNPAGSVVIYKVVVRG